MIFACDKTDRWKLFEYYAARLLRNSDDTALSTREFSDFHYLKLYFAEDFIQAKLQPWLPSFFTEMSK